MLPVHRREFQTFISYAHTNKAVVDTLYSWLSQTAGLQVWYDDVHLPPGKQIVNYLPEALGKCRSMVIVLSKDSVKSEWIQKEYAAADGQPKDFRIVPVRIEECDPPGFLPFVKWISATNSSFDLETYEQILSSLYYDVDNPIVEQTRDVYVSRTWRESEAAIADQVCAQFIRGRFRLIGDAKDQKSFGERRVESIMSSCGALLAILPHRPEPDLKYFRQEINIARSERMPVVVIAEAGVAIDQDWNDDSKGRCCCISLTPDGDIEKAIAPAIEFMQEEWLAPAHPHYTFFATDFDNSRAQRNRVMRSAMQRVTAVPCRLGEDIKGDGIYSRITDLITGAVMVVADITGHNVNTCTEAGIARGARRHLHLVSGDERARPPFMLRDYEVSSYRDDAELLGILHKLAFPYRRRVLNWELA